MWLASFLRYLYLGLRLLAYRVALPRHCRYSLPGAQALKVDSERLYRYFLPVAGYHLTQLLSEIAARLTHGVTRKIF